MDGAEAVVNAVAVLYEAGRQRFADLHVGAAGELASQARARGIERFVQISAMGASEASPSRYARSKAQGEAAVREHIASAAVMRPSVVFGPGDHFFNRFAAMAMTSPALPLIGGGRTRFQPVFSADVARAVAVALKDPAASGRTYELGGPATYSFRDLMVLMLAEIGRRRLLLPVPFEAARLLGLVCQLAAPLMAPPITADQVEMLRSDNVVCPQALGLAELGVTPSALEPIIPTYLYRFRKGGQYAVANPAAASAQLL
jgi:NADH dehydrogenase